MFKKKVIPKHIFEEIDSKHLSNEARIIAALEAGYKLGEVNESILKYAKQVLQEEVETTYEGTRRFGIVRA